MARHDDRDGISGVRAAYGTSRSRASDALCQGSVADGLAEWNADELGPDFLLKVAALRIKREIELLALACEVLCELGMDFFDSGWIPDVVVDILVLISELE